MALLVRRGPLGIYPFFTSPFEMNLVSAGLANAALG